MQGKRGPRTNNRLFIDAVLWMARAGARWRDLPERFGRCGTVKQRYYYWIERGVFSEIFKALAIVPAVSFAWLRPSRPSPNLAERCDHRSDGQKQGAAVRRIFGEFGTGHVEALRTAVLGLQQHRTDPDALEQRVTKDGYGEMIAVNYFAPWLLTDTLRETLVHSAPSRIVTVGSEASRQSGGLDIEKDLLDIAPFTARGSSRIYGRTKLLDIMFSLELARQLDGTEVAVSTLCPGFNVTGLGRELSFARPLAGFLTWLGIGNPERGAGAIIRLATDPIFGKQTGTYVAAKNARLLTPVAPADNEEARRQLWEKTAETLSRFH